jgi:hypothetical protein
MLPNHAFITFATTKQPQNAIVTIRKEIDEDISNEIADFLDENFKRINKSHQWMIKADEAHALCAEIDKIVEEIENEDDESDDELIQEAMARRFKTVSEHKVDDRELVEDSEDEHIIGISRRLRHIYNKIHKLTLRVEELERRN